MTLAKVLSVSLCLGVGSLAFASDPTPPDPTPPAATAATAPATADAASTAAADKAAADKAAADKAAAADQAKSAATTAKTATSPEGLTPDQVKTLRAAHYKPSVRKGVTSYCRSETQLGSRFEVETCGTPEDILRSIAASQQLVNQMQHATYTGAGVH
jgi:hypothetical protein